MGLIKFHLAFSFLCWLTLFGIIVVFKPLLKKNGYNIHWYTPFKIIFESLIPVLNVICVIVFFGLLFIKKETIEKKRRRVINDMESRNIF